MSMSGGWHHILRVSANNLTLQLKKNNESALPQFWGPVLGKMLNTVVGRTYSRKRINDEFTQFKVSRQRKCSHP
jgi:hypothetical protein